MNLNNYIFSNLITILLFAAFAPVANAQKPVWFETDSAVAIHSRILADFPYTVAEATKILSEKYPGITEDKVREYAAKHYIEIRNIDGTDRMHRRSVGNLGLLNPDMNGGWKYRGWNASEKRISFADSILSFYRGSNSEGLGREVTYRFSIDVPYDPILEGDTLKVWIPFPRTTERQSSPQLISSFPAENIVSNENQSVHSSVFLQQPVTKGQPTHFEIVAKYRINGLYYSPEQILTNLKPYNKKSQLYKKYTAFEDPHIIPLESLAKTIVGNETNPYRQSELVYDYIIKHYPWAGAREYSTIECLPQYVIDEGHGDCGQVALLYISLMRSLGVPARWESGWMIHPGEINLHDWAQVYFEGIGWVPVDVSFGRYTPSPDPQIQHFYSTGIDSHRLAANAGVCGEFYPQKKFIRSETVDFQLGEVESTKGNLFYPGWKRKFEILENKTIAYPSSNKSAIEYATDLVKSTKNTYAPDTRQVIFDITASGDSTLAQITGKTNCIEAKKILEKARHATPQNISVDVELLPDTLWGQVMLSAIMMRTGPRHSAEGATQGIMGMPVKLFEKDGEWWRAQTPDGYISWIPQSSIVRKTAAELDAWRDTPRLVVTATYQTRAYNSEKTTGVRDVVTDLVNGCIMEGVYNPKAKRLKVTLPDGRTGWVDTADVTPIEKWASQPFDAQKILDIAYSMEGSPYLWGGTSTKALDCSGLAKVSYLSNGIILMRDASQQALTGTRIEASDWPTCQAGDLLFFGNADTKKVTHVAIYDNNGNYVHSSGRVKRNSVDPNSPAYLTTPFLHAVRIHGNEGTNGITRAINHPWYFNNAKELTFPGLGI